MHSKSFGTEVKIITSIIYLLTTNIYELQFYVPDTKTKSLDGLPDLIVS